METVLTISIIFSNIGSQSPVCPKWWIVCAYPSRRISSKFVGPLFTTICTLDLWSLRTLNLKPLKVSLGSLESLERLLRGYKPFIFSFVSNYTYTIRHLGLKVNLFLPIKTHYFADFLGLDKYQT